MSVLQLLLARADEKVDANIKKWTDEVNAKQHRYNITIDHIKEDFEKHIISRKQAMKYLDFKIFETKKLFNERRYCYYDNVTDVVRSMDELSKNISEKPEYVFDLANIKEVVRSDLNNCSEDRTINSKDDVLKLKEELKRIDIHQEISRFLLDPALKFLF